MGNYSYLIEIINHKNTKIDHKGMKKAIEDINKEFNCYYMYYIFEKDFPQDKEEHIIETFEDFANSVHGNKLCGYLTQSYRKKLCKCGLYMKNEDGKNPIMYFEEEGWDRIHMFKFFPGTEKVEHNTFAFDFDTAYYETKFKENKIQSVSCLSILKKNDVLGNDIYEYVEEKRKDYIYNLIRDSNTKWRNYILDYSIIDNNNITQDVLLSLFLRPEDIQNNRENTLIF